MTTFTDVFGADTVPPSDSGFAAYSIAANGTFVWANNYSGAGLLVADVVEITATAGLTLTLPPANAVSVGEQILIRNVGANSFDVLDADAGSLFTVATGEAKFVYVKDNATAAGVWGSFGYGAGTSSADASALASYGVKALSGKLATDHPYIEKSGNYTVMESDRAKLINVTAGSVTISLPQASTVGSGFFVMVRNTSLGLATIDPYNTELVDGELTFEMSPGESAVFVNSGAGWYTVGYGRDVEFAFSEFVVNAAAGSVALSAGDVAGRMIRIAGTAVGNIVVTLPAVDNIYFVNVENGMGAFNVTFTTGAGTTVVLNANSRTAIYSDGTNVTSAITTALTSTIALDDGSASTPTLAFVLDADTGLFRKGGNQLGVAAGGSEVGYFDSNGFNGQAFLTGTPTAPTAAAGTNTTQIATTAHVFAERSNTLTLTNKTVNLTSNTLTGTKAQFNTALSDDDFGYLGTANTWTAKQTVNADLEVAGNARRILGLFGDATPATRPWIQASTANSFSAVGIMPSGSGTYSEISVINSSDPANASVGYLACNGATGVQLVSSLRGTGTFLPIQLVTGGLERVRITPDGSVGVGTTTPNYAGYTTALTIEGTTNAALEIATTRADTESALVGSVEWNFRSGAANHQRLASIQAITSGTTATQRGAALVFSTKANASTALVERSRVTAAGNVEHINYTKLGESSPAIKVKKLTGTTAASQGASANIPHGITASKIIGIQALVTYGGAGATVVPEYSFSAGYQFSVTADSVNIRVDNHPTNSANILSRGVILLVTYEE